MVFCSCDEIPSSDEIPMSLNSKSNKWMTYISKGNRRLNFWTFFQQSSWQSREQYHSIKTQNVISWKGGSGWYLPIIASEQKGSCERRWKRRNHHTVEETTQCSHWNDKWSVWDCCQWTAGKLQRLDLQIFLFVDHLSIMPTCHYWWKGRSYVTAIRSVFEY